MGVRNLRFENDPILRKKSKQIDVIDNKIKQLANDMIKTMQKHNGVGLAAVQVGILKRLVVIQVDEKQPPIVMVNPKILETKGKRICDEGCLSFPNKFAKVQRPEYVKVEFTNLDNEKVVLDTSDLLAQAVCHETDHLEGIVFVDVMEDGTLQTG